MPPFSGDPDSAENPLPNNVSIKELMCSKSTKSLSHVVSFIDTEAKIKNRSVSGLLGNIKRVGR
ncbi:hypothetical protein DPMN_121845 [Dreissena polymorpha]|uniref:Uncharacterized protein n=1 Tax=Dreissena polymorpha TaxID=45954 RepID=A0A9D4JPY1_DREPO|nr:hypothetical protein DPMN_121845 [Dreissena polymorpha]